MSDNLEFTLQGPVFVLSSGDPTRNPIRVDFHPEGTSDGHVVVLTSHLSATKYRETVAPNTTIVEIPSTLKLAAYLTRLMQNTEIRNVAFDPIPTPAGTWTTTTSVPIADILQGASAKVVDIRDGNMIVEEVADSVSTSPAVSAKIPRSPAIPKA